MPRIFDSTSEPIDFCNYCFQRNEDIAFEVYGARGDGPDGRGNCFGYDSPHPEYSGEDYDCYKCGKRLTDNNA